MTLNPRKAAVLVTGGSGGIGAEVVRRFAGGGHAVAFSHLGDAKGAVALLKELEGKGGPAFAFESDTAEPGEVAVLHSQAAEALGGPPGILVLCAGITRDGMLWKLPVADFDAVLAVNLRGAWLQMRAAAPAMRAAGWGRIVLIGSINGERGKAGQSAYAASKAGLIGLARSAARELGRKGITVNVVEPGWVETAMTARVPEEFRERARAEALDGKLGTPADVAAAVLWLCSSAASHVTGQILRIDGGQALG